MYNESQKQEFLSSLKPESIKGYISFCQKSEIYERAAGHDLCDFIYNEYLGLFESCQYTRVSTFKTNKSFLNDYLEFCCANKYCNSNCIVELSRLQFTDLTGYAKLRNEFFFSLDDMLDSIEYVFSNSKVDVTYSRPVQIYYGLVWAGLEEEQIFALTPENVCGGMISTSDVYLDLPYRLDDLIQKYISDEYFITADGRHRNYKHSGYIFKTSKGGMATSGWITDKNKQWRECAKNLNVTDPLFGKKLYLSSIKKSALYSDIFNHFRSDVSINQKSEFDRLLINLQDIDKTNNTFASFSSITLSEYHKWFNFYKNIDRKI